MTTDKPLTIDELLEEYRAENTSEREKGDKFERLMKNFLLTYPPYLGRIAEVMLWKNFSDERDLGIDLVAKTFDGEFWAVQCKFYAETASVDKGGVDSFISNSGRTFNGRKFSARIFIATTNNFTPNAEAMFQNQAPPVIKIALEDLRQAAVDWEKISAGITGTAAVISARDILKHQRAAINAVHEYFQTSERGKLIMACGTGKTFTSLKIAERETNSGGLILYLVPSLSLLSQILREWSTFAEIPIRAICVCSDSGVASKNDDDEIQSVSLPVPVSTDSGEIAREILNARRHATGMTVVFSTYQSLERVGAAQKIFNADFDLAICDEAHRTTGNSAHNKDTKKIEAPGFIFVHSNQNIRARRRLYMTATPRLYSSDAKKKAAAKDLTVWSMDDTEIFGEEIYQLSFSDALDEKLLVDYKVLILTLSDKFIPRAFQDAIASKEISASDVIKLIGCVNALSKIVAPETYAKLEGDTNPMHTAVSFCGNIKNSRQIVSVFEKCKNEYYDDLPADIRAKTVKVSAVHVDGSQGANFRNKEIKKLRDAPTEGLDCRMLSNVRCLSEGVDVPALDAVLFLSPKKSKVDIVQAVGRVMRRADAKNKKYGYVIIPAIVSIGNSPEAALENSPDFHVVWDVLNALRSHDARVDIEVQNLRLSKKIVVNPPPIDDDKPYQTEFDFGALQEMIYAKIVEHVGNRRYWQEWAADIADISKAHQNHMLNLIETSPAHREIFDTFLADLHKNINPTIAQDAALEMLAQHLVSRPVFDALFKDYSLASNNAVSKSIETVLSSLDAESLEADNKHLQKFYKSVRERCERFTEPAERQRIITELYDKFFKIALPLTVQQLGIVYTPPEVVDFILNSVSDALQKHFHRNISDKNIHVLEPFAGTGTFLARLIQSGLIRPNDLLRKYQDELHANEIVLLAYYIAAVNIENAFHDASRRQDYLPFNGICLTDTFQTYENDNRSEIYLAGMENPLHENSGRIKDQLDTKIEIIIGNPPYSVGQKSANDNAQNIHYSKLEKLIADTYAAKTDATLKSKIYDSYIKAFRWASERISEGGIVGFVTNAGWLDGAGMDGLRACFEQDFSHIYIFNLRGNQRTQGETSRREGGKIFGSGSRAPIAITILVKVPDSAAPAEIHYCDIGDYLSRDDKLARIQDFKSALSDNFRANEIIIRPNNKHDWINQRNSNFGDFIILGDKKDTTAKSFFNIYSLGVATNRDAWAYNFSNAKLAENMQTTIDFYNSHSPEDIDTTKITWTEVTVKCKQRGIYFKFDAAKIVESIYRPFCKEYLYYDEHLNQRRYQMPKLFPTGAEENLLICVSGIGGEKDLSVLMTNKIIDLNSLQAGTQCFPLYWYEPSQSRQQTLEGFGDNYERRDGVTDWILEQARWRYFLTPVTKEDIFYYVYGFLHLPAYREKYAAELKKSLPRIILAERAEDFWRLSEAGRALAALHLNYETQEAPAGVEVVGAREDLRVTKMKLVAEENGTLTLIYNAGLKIVGIPARAKEYVVNGRSPLEWLVERYQIKTDKASGITNDPNDWCAERGEPDYILRLAQSLITVSLRTLEIVEKLPAIKFE